MEKYIHNYLSLNYYIETSDVGNDGIYEIADARRFKAPINGDRLLKELVTVFYIDEVQLKAHIEGWAASKKPDIDLEWFWKEIESLMPIAMKVAAQTVGLDLVAVLPMAAPTGLFTLIEYSGDTPDRNGRVYNSEVFRQQLDELIHNHQNFMLTSELDHPDLPMALGTTIGVSSRKSEEIERQSWFNKKTEE
jgi:hypothetical protein